MYIESETNLFVRKTSFAHVIFIVLLLISMLVSSSTHATDRPALKPETADMHNDANRAKNC